MTCSPTARFGGNPLAIVEEADALSDGADADHRARVQPVGNDLRAEAEDPANTASVRIFFPTAEIPFAGHPTVGCAIHLAQKKYKAGCSFETTIRLEEVAGLVPVKVSRIGDVPRAQFTAPVDALRRRTCRCPSVEDDGAGAVACRLPISASTAMASALFQGGPALPLCAAEQPRGAGAGAGRSSRTGRAMLSRWAPAWPISMRAAAIMPDTHYRARMLRRPTASRRTRPRAPPRPSSPPSFSRPRGSTDGTHRWQLEQGYEMGRPSDLWLEADVADAKLVAVRVAGQAVQIMSGVLEL